ncbi:MAG: hypothetical protein ACOCQD_02550 [archaeon]
MKNLLGRALFELKRIERYMVLADSNIIEDIENKLKESETEPEQRDSFEGDENQ